MGIFLCYLLHYCLNVFITFCIFIFLDNIASILYFTTFFYKGHQAILHFVFLHWVIYINQQKVFYDVLEGKSRFTDLVFTDEHFHLFLFFLGSITKHSMNEPQQQRLLVSYANLYRACSI